MAMEPAVMLQMIQNLEVEVTGLKEKNGVMEQEILNLKAQVQKPPDGKKNLKEMKGFSDVPSWNGKETDFADFEFKLGEFVQGITDFEKYLQWIKDRDQEPTEDDINNLMVPAFACYVERVGLCSITICSAVI